MNRVRHTRGGLSRVAWLGVLLLGLWGWLGAAPAALAVETVTYYHLDALGSPVAASDAQGALLWREAYRPYGQRLRDAHGGAERLGYTAKPEEAAFGLAYFGARWYDPALGRFLGIDPAGFAENNPHSFNRYAYANNNPYTYVDPDGRLGTLVHALQRGVSLEQAARVGQAGTAALGGYAAKDYLENVAAGTYAQQPLARYGELLDGVMRRDPNATEALVNEIGIPGSVAARGAGVARAWTTKARLKAAELPTTGKIRYVPPKGYNPSQPLPRGPSNGYIDRFGNEWVKGPSRTQGQTFEWDVQLSRTGREQLGWATRDNRHLNVSLDGKITH